MKEIYLHEFNILMDKKAYLPNASGMLRAYAEANQQIAESYRFMPFLFIRQHPKKIVAVWNDPSVLAFSSSMWNHQLNLVLARNGRELFPEALIVFGGPHIPADAKGFLKQHLFIDVVVRGEGEVAFSELLVVFLNGRDFSRVGGIVYRDSKTNEFFKTSDRELADVSQLPSPYLAGLYDDLLDRRDGIEYQVILETNRGCPFRCTYCSWGNGIAKIRTFDIGRVKKEIEWIAERRIQYVFGADANFGMLPRDYEIAELFVGVKQQTGYPHTFRVCYGKNATDRIFEVAKLLEESKLTTGVTVSFQSTDPATLANIGRSNIRIDAYRDLLRRYRAQKIRVYTELILGLPGETYQTFSHGIEEVFQAGLYDQVGIFFCEILPNTQMDDPAYASLHGIQAKSIELAEPHALKRNPEDVPEFESIVIATNSMPCADWKRSATLAWMAQVMHGMKTGFFIALYLFRRFGIRYTELFEYAIKASDDAMHFPVFSRERDFHAEFLDGILQGRPQCVFLDEFGKISWQIEEATFLRISKDLGRFYREFEMLVTDLLKEKNLPFMTREVEEVVRYQSARMASIVSNQSNGWGFSYNLPEYFDRLLSDLSASTEARPQKMTVMAADYHGDKEEFARQVVWFGRRDCRALESAVWR